jgi:pyrroloquinoline quinone biosynthesis protein B
MVAIGSHDRWYLVNAPPDLSSQIEASAGFHPNFQSLRNSPIEGVLLTSADLDQVLGIFSLREGSRLRISATKAVRDTLEQNLRLGSIMEVFCGAVWTEPPVEKFAPLFPESGENNGIQYRAIPLPGLGPRFSRKSGGWARIAYEFMAGDSGQRVLIAPGVASMTPALSVALQECSLVLLDGTFWSEAELMQIRPGATTASEMGHLPMQASLEFLKKCPARHKVFVHINNTNPALQPGSSERAAVEKAGVCLSPDGAEFEL